MAYTAVRNERSSRERTVQGTNVPGNEWSWERKFHHGNECSRERIVLGTNIPDTQLEEVWSTVNLILYHLMQYSLPKSIHQHPHSRWDGYATISRSPSYQYFASFSGTSTFVGLHDEWRCRNVHETLQWLHLSALVQKCPNIRCPQNDKNLNFLKDMLHI